MEARLHEKLPEVSPESVPNRDIRITEEFLRDHEPLLIFLGAKVLAASLETSGALDSDVCEALESMIRTYRTLQSGLYYESRPDNLVAAAIHQKVQDAIQELRKDMAEKGITAIRDAEVLGVLAFLQRVALAQRNGRPKGRSFIDYLRAHFPQKQQSSADAPLLIQV
jgi:hypothetical protein